MLAESILKDMWEITDKQLSDHAEWLESNGARGVRLDKTGRDLSNSAHPRAKMDQGKFIGARFNHANLEGASFAEADFSGARLEGANLKGANFRGADLGGVTLDGADMTGADLSNADCSGATFRKANLTNTICTNIDFVAADLTGAKQDGMKITGESRLRDAQGLQPGDS